MRIKDPMTEGEEALNLVPLTDMVFNLLIFFMCATTFAQVEKELSVQLPRPASFAPLSAAPKQLIINIKQDGAMVVDGKTYDEDGLSQLVSAEVKKDHGKAILVRPDERSIMHYYAIVTRICTRAGVDQARLVYLDEQGKQEK